MKSLRSSINTALTLGVCSLAIPASADVFNPNDPVPELHSVGGSNTSGSFAAASQMGEVGFNNAPIQPSWETFITSACTTQTKTVAPSSVWPAVCNPDGMALALNTFTPAHWVTFRYPGTAAGQTNALNETVLSLQFYHSPAVVPIYGQADHWVVVNQITALFITSTTFTIQQVKGYDGGPSLGNDSSFNTYNGGLQSWSGNTWKNVFFLVLTAINPSCDFVAGGCGAPPVSDPFYGQYLLMFEPPAGDRPHLDTTFAKSAGIVPAGHMNEHLAQSRLWDSLINAGINNDPEIWNAISGAKPGPASLVNAVFPDGSPWNYFLVPLLSNNGMVTAFVQLDADDGSFDHIQVLPTPAPFTAVPKATAAQLAHGALADGETLNDGVLTWDPRNPQTGRSPSFPYYEFGVAGAAKGSAPVRVMLHDGSTVRGR